MLRARPAPVRQTRRLPAPCVSGRPPGVPRERRYSTRKLVGEVPLLTANAQVPLQSGERRRMPLSSGGAAVLERTRVGHYLWHCPSCGRRTRTLHLADTWACRECSRLDYPSQRVSRAIRSLAARCRRQLGVRTLDASVAAIKEARLQLAMDRAKQFALTHRW